MNDNQSLLKRLFGSQSPLPEQVAEQIDAVRRDIQQLEHERSELAEALVDAYGDAAATKRLSEATRDNEQRLETARGALQRLEREQVSALNRRMFSETQAAANAALALWRDYCAFKTGDFAAIDRAYQEAVARLNLMRAQTLQAMRELPDAMNRRRDELSPAEREAWARSPEVREVERTLAAARREIDL